MNKKLKEYEKHVLKKQRRRAKPKKLHSRKSIGYKRTKLKETKDIYNSTDYLNNWSKQNLHTSYKGITAADLGVGKPIGLEMRPVSGLTTKGSFGGIRRPISARKEPMMSKRPQTAKLGPGRGQKNTGRSKRSSQNPDRKIVKKRIKSSLSQQKIHRPKFNPYLYSSEMEISPGLGSPGPERHRHIPPPERVDVCKDPIKMIAEDYEQAWKHDQRTLKRNLVSQKFANRGNLRNKEKLKKRRLDIQRKVNEMEKTLNLMEKKHLLKNKDIVFKEKMIKERRSVDNFKRGLREKKAMYQWETAIIEKRQKIAGRRRRKKTIRNRDTRVKTMLEQKQRWVLEKKAKYFEDVERLQQEKIEDLVQKAKKAEKIREDRKLGRLKRIEFVKSRFQRTHQRLKEDIRDEQRKISSQRFKAEMCMQYEEKLANEIEEVDEKHQVIDDEFNQVGDVLVRPKSRIMAIEFGGFKRSHSKMDVFNDEDHDSEDSSFERKRRHKEMMFNKELGGEEDGGSGDGRGVVGGQSNWESEALGLGGAL